MTIISKERIRREYQQLYPHHPCDTSRFSAVAKKLGIDAGQVVQIVQETATSLTQHGQQGQQPAGHA